MLTKNLMWFRHDLRLQDNPAFTQAASQGYIIPIFILDPEENLGRATKLWLHHALKSLNTDLGGNLQIYEGPSREVIQKLCKDNDIENICANVAHTPFYRKLDSTLNIHLTEANLLYKPEEVLNLNKEPYKVFTPFKKRCLQLQYRALALSPKSLQILKSQTPSNYNFKEEEWHLKMLKYWDISESGACKSLERFVSNGLAGYKDGRNYPSQPHVSRLSPYLRHGQISPHQILDRIASLDSPDVEMFISELLWREFSYYLLYYWPELNTKNFNPAFDNFPWGYDAQNFKAWTLGQTGYPFVDAAMRELWETGYMHNRARMVVASFLIKNLNIHWKYGEQWFWDCLFDADLASNSASWQWVSGSGADTNPFRMFNATLQGEKFDPTGSYARQWIPEIGDAKYPYKEPLPPSYPRPIVDASISRKIALEKYKSLNKTPVEEDASISRKIALEKYKSLNKTPAEEE